MTDEQLIRKLGDKLARREAGNDRIRRKINAAKERLRNRDNGQKEMFEEATK